MRFAVDRLDHIVINCRDIEVMASWYQRVLGMEREDFGSPPRVALKFGGQKINLRPADHPTEDWIAAGTCLPGTQDLCFIVAVAVDDIVGQFHACGVRIELGPVTRQGALGPMGSVYCRDPEGNLVEVSSYSP
ncbi:VOC family protein [Paracraurococcus lichenis]|uniref:VOC family protein n=1 Tax=Paracraurococcus lichenis TaxID=3064888 RepID=A0ABT9E523_9PROT|nr:VOC family protein [Paracraurococcus sp. LOR1-02]MDO9711207.1 VOC family protein [Paracraurococcus sp. LOR1-02]